MLTMVISVVNNDWALYYTVENAVINIVSISRLYFCDRGTGNIVPEMFITEIYFLS